MNNWQCWHMLTDVNVVQVLLSNGDAWELERCDCAEGDGINCDGKTTNRLLVGYEHWR